jgi:hypothetical protein
MTTRSMLVSTAQVKLRGGGGERASATSDDGEQRRKLVTYWQ